MDLMDYELAGGPLGQVIVQHLAPEDRQALVGVAPPCSSAQLLQGRPEAATSSQPST